MLMMNIHLKNGGSIYCPCLQNLLVEYKNENCLWNRFVSKHNSISLPIAETQLQKLLGKSYVDEHWWTALVAVMNVEGDAMQAVTAVEKLATAATHQTGLTIKIPISWSQSSPQLVIAEEELKDSMNTQRDRNRIFSIQLTMDEILEPWEETVIGKPMFQFENDVAIATVVQYQLAVERGDIIEVDSDDDEDVQPGMILMSPSEIVLLCEKLKMACISWSHAGASLELIRHVHKFHGEMHREELQNMKQTLWIVISNGR